MMEQPGDVTTGSASPVWTRAVGSVSATLDRRGVATVLMDNPPNNMLNLELVQSLLTVLSELDADVRSRAVILASAGKHFCPGVDFGPGAAGVDPRDLYGAAAPLFSTALPVVAAVAGSAIGGGLGLALAADFRVVSARSRLSANFARLGLHHGFALSVTLPAAVGVQRARELLLTGRRLTGVEAVQIGLADRLAAEGMSVLDVASEVAGEVAAGAPLAVRSIKRTLRNGLLEQVSAAMDRESRQQSLLLPTADFREGVLAAIQRREPRFLGR